MWSIGHLITPSLFPRLSWQNKLFLAALKGEKKAMTLRSLTPTIIKIRLWEVYEDIWGKIQTHRCHRWCNSLS